MTNTIQNTVSDYDQQALDFLKDTNTELKITFLATMPYFDDDKEKRDVFTFSLARNGMEYTGKFGDSTNNTIKRQIARLNQFLPDPTPEHAKFANTKNFGGFADWFKKNGKAIREWYKTNKTPSAYDILACLTKYEPGSFEDFCANYGYDEDSRKAFDTYQNVLKEWAGVCRLFNAEERELLADIN